VQKQTLAQGQAVDPFLAVVLAVVDPLNGKNILECFDCVGERYAVLLQIGVRFVVVPFETDFMI
jgi:hypothetical protein